MGRARISDVAAAAGVSVTTVSLVLNDAESRISEQTRIRVRAAAEAVGYAPSAVARGLRTQRTRIVGLLSDQIATTPFAGRMLAGAQDAAREHDHLVLFIDTGGDAGIEADALRALAAQQVDGMIYACMWHRAVDVPAGLPRGSVLLDCYPEEAASAASCPMTAWAVPLRCESCSPPDTAASRTSTPTTPSPSPRDCVTRATSKRWPRRASRPTPRSM